MSLRKESEERNINKKRKLKRSLNTKLTVPFSLLPSLFFSIGLLQSDPWAHQACSAYNIKAMVFSCVTWLLDDSNNDLHFKQLEEAPKRFSPHMEMRLEQGRNKNIRNFFQIQRKGQRLPQSLLNFQVQRKSLASFIAYKIDGT